MPTFRPRPVSLPHYQPVKRRGGGYTRWVISVVLQGITRYRHGMTTTVRRIVIAVTLCVAALLGAVPTSAEPAALPACAEEDGNTNGLPCTWTDPDTGTRYWVSSENYR